VSGTYVRARVGAEDYALPVEEVVEVDELGEVTPMPGAPPAVLGVCNLRGQVVPVVDLATVLGLADAPKERMMIVEDESGRAALVVSEVMDVGTLPEISEQTDSDLLRGAVIVDGALVGVIDVKRVLDAVGGVPET
jgi:purine-binding chemotaxis protein CheW